MKTTKPELEVPDEAVAALAEANCTVHSPRSYIAAISRPVVIAYLRGEAASLGPDLASALRFLADELEAQS